MHYGRLITARATTRGGERVRMEIVPSAKRRINAHLPVLLN